MSDLKRREWNKFVTMLSAVNKTAGKKMQAWINAHGTDDVQALVEYAYALVTRYGEAAAAVACQMYDEVAERQKVHVPPAEPKATQHINYVDKAIRSTLQRAPGTVPSTVSEMVKRTGAETTLKNAMRDGAYFAWVPNGDTCAFCITLASNGWRRASRKTAGGDHAEHIHKNCDCEFAVSFNGPGRIEGYDPDKYLDMYENAEGDTWKEKVNSMRRAQYAADPEKYRLQKREAYARRNVLKMNAGVKLPLELTTIIPGKRITEEQLIDVQEHLKKAGIIINADKIKKFGGFEEYQGNPEILHELAETVMEHRYIWGKNSSMPIKLGYEPLGNLDDFAIVRKGVIILNKDIFDDSDYLKRYYEYMTTHGSESGNTWFVPGTSYRSIILHEIGHRIMAKDKLSYGRLRELIVQKFGSVEGFCLKHLSEYAMINTRGRFEELVSELFSAADSSETERREIARELLKEVYRS